jgi:hypothetical protein
MAASLFATGKIAVASAGTPVNVPVPSFGWAGPAQPVLSTVHAFIIQALSTNAGKIYVGVAGLNKTTLAGVLVVLPVPTVNLIPTFSVSVTEGANALSLSDLWIDADNSGEGVTISGVIA